jgi:hypothetical protein
MKKEVLILIFLFIPLTSSSLNNPSIKWFVYESEGFKVIYQEGARRTAEEIARLLEEKIFTGVIEETGFTGDRKVSIIVADESDIPNGFAVEEYDLVFIYSTNLYLPIRGRHLWTGNVTAHELTHIFARRMKSIFGRNIPFLTVGGVGIYEDRAHNRGCEVFIFIPFPDKVEPSWFTEGLAQLISEKLGFDSWDTTRDMLLRTAVYEEKLLTYDEIVSFKEKKGISPEMVYNQGYSFLRFITKKHEGLLKELIRKRSSFVVSFEKEYEKITGEPLREVYSQWKAEMKRIYSEKLKEIGEEVKGEKVKDDSFFILFSGIHENRGFFVKGEESFFMNKLVFEDGKHEKKIDSFISSPPSFSPDGKKIIYTRYKVTHLDSIISELKIYELNSGKKKTGVERAFFPVYSPDSSYIAYVKNIDGTHNIYFLKDGKEKKITDFQNGEQIAGMDFLNENEMVLSLYSRGKQDLWILDINSKNLKRITDTPEEERDVRRCGDGKIVFSADYNGIFNIYLGDLKEGKIYQLTNLKGGGFYPYPSSDCSRILYSAYTKDGYNIYEVGTEKMKEKGSFKEIRKGEEKEKEKRMMDEFVERSRSYRFISNPVHLYPAFLYYLEGIGFGLGLDYSDKLLKHILGAGTLINTNGDLILSGAYVNRSYYPTFIIKGNRSSRSSRLANFITRGRSTYTELEFYSLFPLIPLIPFTFVQYRNFSRDYIDETALELRGGRVFESYGFGGGLAVITEDFSFRLQYIKRFTNGINLYLFNLPNCCEGRNGFDEYWFDRFYLKVEKSLQIGEIAGIETSLEGGMTLRNVSPYDEFAAGGILYPLLIYEPVDFINLPGYRPMSIFGETAFVFHFGIIPPSIKIKTNLFPFYLSSIQFRIFSDLGYVYKSGEKKMDPERFLPDIGIGFKVNSDIFYNYSVDLSFDVAYGLKSYKTQVCTLLCGKSSEETRWLGYYLTVGMEF